MKTKKLTGIVVLFTILCLIALFPAKSFAAEDYEEYEKVALGQAINVEKGVNKFYSMDLQAGQIIYIDCPVYNAHYVSSGYFDYYMAKHSVNVYPSYENYELECLGDNVYYVKETGTINFRFCAKWADSCEVTKPEGGTVKIVDGTQKLAAKQTKGSSLGNNVYKFKPSVSGVYAFTAKANGSSAGYGHVNISFTYDGRAFNTVENYSDANYSCTSAFNSRTMTAKLEAGTTYYIYGYAFNETYNPYTGGNLVDNGYTLSITQSPSVPVRKASISKAASPKSKKIKVTWKKTSGVSGYEISYSTYKSMKDAKTVFASKSKKEKTIGNLLKKTVYYVRIRGYKTVKGNKYYGSYSKRLKVKTK